MYIVINNHFYNENDLSIKSKILIALSYLILILFAELRYKTGIDLEVEIDARYVAALPDGEAVVKIHTNDTVARVNKQGMIVKNLYTHYDVRGLLVQGSHLFGLHMMGTIVKMQPEDGVILKVYNTGVNYIFNYGSQHSDLCDIDQNVLLLPAYYGGTVYTYNISSQTLKPQVNNLNKPTSVTRGCVDGNVMYVVCERGAHKVHVYNVTWSLVLSFGVYGTGYGQIDQPSAAVMSDQGHIFVNDMMNYRVSMFTSDGQFVKYIITYEGEGNPCALSVRGQYLWMSAIYGSYGRLIRYIL